MVVEYWTRVLGQDWQRLDSRVVTADRGRTGGPSIVLLWPVDLPPSSPEREVAFKILGYTDIPIPDPFERPGPPLRLSFPWENLEAPTSL